MPNEITDADTLSTKARKALDTMRARAVKADEARTDAAHAAEAWDALAAHAATQTGQCRHVAALADRTQHRWAG